MRHGLNCLPEEACGLLAMDGSGRIRMAYPLTNADHSSSRFTISPVEHFGAIRHAEGRGWEIGGVFHSHPSGPSVLSATDLDQPHDPEWLHIVVGLAPTIAIRAWRIDNGRPLEVTLSSTRLSRKGV